MYFPYFRGRMYELIALRELATNGLLSKRVIPVVEPIKFTSTFDGLLKVFNEGDLKLAVIYNPEVGDLSNEASAFETLYSEMSRYECVIPAVMMNKNADLTISALKSKNILSEDIIVVLNRRDFEENYTKLFKHNTPAYTLAINDRQILKSIKNGKVIFQDRFVKQERNTDYKDREDEFFSDDHLYYYEEHFEGFGDYSIIGDVYNDGGFAPRAVAIHIVYFDNAEALRIHHFVSDSDKDISDVAGKFYEAVMKLHEWYEKNKNQKLTFALQTLLNHAHDGTYPGLPTIKKLSIMHHLELMGGYLDRSIDG